MHIYVKTVLCICVCIVDYGLTTLRINHGVANDPVKVAREEACRIYQAPEISTVVNPPPTGPADVFSYAVILFEIATRADPYFVCIYHNVVYICTCT